MYHWHPFHLAGFLFIGLSTDTRAEIQLEKKKKGSWWSASNNVCVQESTRKKVVW